MKKLSVVYALVIIAMVLSACGAPATTQAPAATATTAPAAAEPTATTAPVAAEPTATTAPAAKPEDVCKTDTVGCAKIEKGQTIKIGMGAPMTGGNSSFGIDISQGATIAVQDAGEFQGFKFELVAQDDGGTAEGGATVANKLVADPTVVAIAGHIFSGATAAAMPIYEKAGLPMLSPSATNPPLTQQGSKVFNRIAFTDATQGRFAAKYMFEKLGIKNLAIMHDGSDYGKGLAEIVKENFTADGGTVTDFVAITPKETDYTAPLSQIAAKKPEAVYFGGYIAEGSIIANQMKQTGLEKAIFFGCDGTYGADFLTQTGKNGEGAYAVTLTPAESPDKAKFDAAYKAAFGKDPGTLSPYTWNGYDVAAILIKQIESVAVVGSDGNLYIPRGALVNAVRTMKDVKGLTGTFTCDATGECNASGPIWVIVKDGKWVPAP